MNCNVCRGRARGARLVWALGAFAGGVAFAGQTLDFTSALFGGALSGAQAAGSGRLLDAFETFTGRGGVFGDGSTLTVLAPVASGPNQISIQTVSADAGSRVEEARYIGEGFMGGQSFRSWFVRTQDGVVIAKLSGSGPYALSIMPLATGTFGSSNTNGLATADVTGDGVPDIVVVNSGLSQVVVYPGLGGGMLGAPMVTQTAAPAGTLRGVVLADLDNDGDLDINALSSPGGVYPLENNGSGSFGTFSQNQPTTTYGTDARTAVSSDFNLDGFVDLYKLSASGEGRLLIGDGAGGFLNGASNTLPSGAGNPILGDFDGDGLDDVITVNFGHDTAAYLRNDGAGALNLNQLFATGDGPVSALAGDWDNDGDTDLIISHAGVNFPQGPLLVEHTGVFGLTLYESILTRNLPDARAMAVGDFSGNGYRDVILGTTNNWLRMYFGSPSGLSTSNIIVTTNLNAPILGTLERLEGDAHDLLIFATPAAPTAGVLRYNPDTGVMESAGSLPLAAPALAVATGDTNGDGIDDVFLSHEGGSPAVTIFPRFADGTFGSPILVHGPGGGHVLVVKDIDGLHGPDIVLADDGIVRYARSTGSAAFAAFVSAHLTGDLYMFDLDVAEVDATPGKDLLVASSAASEFDGRITMVPQILNPGPPQVAPVQGAPRRVHAEDIDFNGLIDILFTLDRANGAGAVCTSTPGPSSGHLLEDLFVHLAAQTPTDMIVADMHESVHEEEGGFITRPSPEAIVLNTGNPALGLRGMTINFNMTELRPATKTPCPGDVDGDNFIGFADLNAVLSAFNTVVGQPGYNAAADFDDDGDVDFGDLNVVLSAFNSAC